MSIGRLITQLRRSIASGHPDLFQEIFGPDPATVIKRYLDKFANHSTFIDLLKDFDEGRKLYANTDYTNPKLELILYSNGILGHSDLLQEQIDDLSHLMQQPVVGITSAEDSPLLDVANTIFGYLSFTHIMVWIVKEQIVRQLKKDRPLLLIGFGHGAAIAQHAIDLLEENIDEEDVNTEQMTKLLQYVSIGGGVSSLPKAKTSILREHFANEHDAISRRGCLSWPEENDKDIPSYGRIFEAPGRFGHMLREHYLIPLSNEPGVFNRIDESEFAKRIVGKIPL